MAASPEFTGHPQQAISRLADSLVPLVDEAGVAIVLDG
jgi:hypothetical protein